MVSLVSDYAGNVILLQSCDRNLQPLKELLRYSAEPIDLYEAVILDYSNDETQLIHMGENHDPRGFQVRSPELRYRIADPVYEDFIGEFRRRLAVRSGPEALNAMQAFTKWVPSPGPMTRQVVERAVDVSRRRMNMETLDLMQFHWWEYRDLRYLDALEQLAALRASGKIRHVGLTNFDTERLKIMLQRGLPIVSNQVQYSLVDRRPEVAMARATASSTAIPSARCWR